jgi:hypothetical protein
MEKGCANRLQLKRLNMKKMTAIAILLALTVIAVALYFAKQHFIREGGGGGAVLWNPDEAYLFMYDCPDGFLMTGPELLAEPIREYFNAPAMPAEGKCFLTVLRVTRSGMERHVQEFETSIDDFTPLDGAIYAHCPGGMCKWNGDKFQLITHDEEQRVGGFPHLSEGEFSNVNGWSERWIRAAFDDQKMDPFKLSITINSSTALLVSGSNPVSVDVKRPNGTTERVWYHKQHTRWVSGATYRRVFDKY